MKERPNAPATERNRDAILKILVDEFGDRHEVLEIGSGTGQHAVFFASKLPHLTWQTSDVLRNHAGIQSWIQHANLPNAIPPMELDVEQTTQIEGHFDAVYSANTAHIMSEHAVACMFGLVGKLLPENGKFCLYGPFNRHGAFTSASNEQFDASLRDQNSSMGIRNLEDLEAHADCAGMHRTGLHAMPANNFLVVWRHAGIR